MTKRKLCFGIASIFATSLSGGLISVPVLAEGPVDISIVEKVDDGSGGYKDWEDITGAMPGMSYSAIPRVLNNGATAVGVRMCLSESVVSATGEEMTLPANTFGLNVNDNWVFESGSPSDPAAGNCYKYQAELGVGAETEPLFTEVTLSPALANEYQGATFSLHLDAYAESGEPVNPPEPADDPGKANLPDSPDTGNVNKSEALTQPAAILLTVGAVTLVIMMGFLLKRVLKKNKNKN